MKLHRVMYETDEDSDPGIVKRRLFAASADAASKLATSLKQKHGKDLVGKPERDVVEVPTDKQGLIDFLNSGAA